MACVLLDVDGVAADFHGALLDQLRRPREPIPAINGSILPQLTEEEQYRARELMADSMFWDDLPVISGSREAVGKLRAAGHHVVWTTSPWAACPEWFDVRCRWLYHNFQSGIEDIIVGQRKELIAGDLLVDDVVGNVERWAVARRRATSILFGTPYNEQDLWRPRADWSLLGDLLPVVCQLINCGAPDSEIEDLYATFLPENLIDPEDGPR